MNILKNICTISLIIVSSIAGTSIAKAAPLREILLRHSNLTSDYTMEQESNYVNSGAWRTTLDKILHSQQSSTAQIVPRPLAERMTVSVSYIIKFQNQTIGRCSMTATNSLHGDIGSDVGCQLKSPHEDRILRHTSYRGIVDGRDYFEQSIQNK